MVTLWHDRATFHFLTDEADQKAYAATAARFVSPGGYLVMAEFAPDGPTSCSGLAVARHSVASLQSIFADGFELIESFEQDHVTPSGGVQRFVHAVLIRHAGNGTRNATDVGLDSSIQISPPWASTSPRAIARPSPPTLPV